MPRLLYQHARWSDWKDPTREWPIETLEQAFLRQGQSRPLITDEDSLFTSDAFGELLRQWEVKHRFGRVGKHASIAVTEWLA